MINRVPPYSKNIPCPIQKNNSKWAVSFVLHDARNNAIKTYENFDSDAWCESLNCRGEFIWSESSALEHSSRCLRSFWPWYVIGGSYWGSGILFCDDIFIRSDIWKYLRIENVFPFGCYFSKKTIQTVDELFERRHVEITTDKEVKIKKKKRCCALMPLFIYLQF